MGARLAPPDGCVIHARQVIEDERCRVRKLHTARRGQHELQGIVAKDPTGGDGSQGAPAVSAAKQGIAGGMGYLGIRSFSKKPGEEIFDRTPRLRLGGIEISSASAGT